MKGHFRQSMAWLHTWSGLVVGWLLFMIFLSGTATYFREEISQWMRPELKVPVVSTESALKSAVRHLSTEAAGAPGWFIRLPDPRNPAQMSAFWEDPHGQFHHAQINAQNGDALTARDTRGGEFFYRLHFDLHYMPAIPARFIVGFCAMIMLVALISGVITHKKIFREFFTFRPGKGPRSWLDAHNALAVLSLPYHLLITYTGLITLIFLYLPLNQQAVYPKEENTFIEEALGRVPPPVANGEAAPLADTGPMLAAASARWDGAPAGIVTIHHPGDSAARVDIQRRDSSRIAFNPQVVVFDGVTGEFLRTAGNPSAAATTLGVLYGLHVARFAEPALRLLLFLAGLAGTAMIGTGLVLWVIKRLPKRAGQPQPFGVRLVAALNRAVVIGLPTAMVVYFWVNRLLPVGMENRAEREIHLFFITWALGLLFACLRPGLRGWLIQIWLASALCAFLPILNALTTDRGLPGSVWRSDSVFIWFDIAMLAFGALLARCAWHLRQRTQQELRTKPHTSDPAESLS